MLAIFSDIFCKCEFGTASFEPGNLSSALLLQKPLMSFFFIPFMMGFKKNSLRPLSSH